MNEADIDDEAPLPASYRPALTVLGYMHASAAGANFLYPADQNILLDVLLRHAARIATDKVHEVCCNRLMLHQTNCSKMSLLL